MTSPVKPWYASKTYWSAIIAVLMTTYNAVAAGRGWPSIPAEVYAVLGSLGLIGLRSANTSIGAAPAPAPASVATNNVVPGPPSPGGQEDIR